MFIHENSECDNVASIIPSAIRSLILDIGEIPSFCLRLKLEQL